MSQNNFTIDQRLHIIKDIVDKMCWDHYIPPKTVTKTAKQFLTEDTTLMGHILKEVTATQKILDEMSTLLTSTNQYCNDLQVEIERGYNIMGLEIPTVEQLLGESLVDDDMDNDEDGQLKRDLDVTSDEKKIRINDDSDCVGLTFCEPTPAKPKSSSKKLYF